MEISGHGEYCERDATCVQYSVNADGRCATGTEFRLGRIQPDYTLAGSWNVWMRKLDEHCPSQNYGRCHEVCRCTLNAAW
ncbi:hypothetical protein CERZMDRAFT_91050 [Cercospora zeae-maydis SCOH1-5]|uniref:Uncharacterized protein n=1 Tax=Cercospora zeae-maydis SCOH1-5 TaxID=717836 RepID=A0A6A6FBH2_9PEZI|nr:hypothetical protein CERZMDRAFT_91050 [Cercospora zeae-maydis SCOH1-5]